jgi:sugar phosphate isomerase/epimerase
MPAMKLAFSTNAFTRHPLQFALEEIARAGFRGVEILADRPHWYPDHFDEQEALQIRSTLEKLRIQVSNVNANCTFGYFSDAPPEAFFEPSLISPDARMRADRIAMIQNTLRFAHAVGAENISITSGKALPTMPPEKCVVQLRESLKPILELAEKLEVGVGFECEPGLFIEWATELHALIDNVGSPMLGANLDIGHSIVMGEEIPATLKLLKGRIWNCHIEDLMGRKHYHLIPGRGNIDWQALHQSLAHIGYDRFLTVELYSYPDQPIEAATESAGFLRSIFAAGSFSTGNYR